MRGSGQCLPPPPPSPVCAPTGSTQGKNYLKHIAEMAHTAPSPAAAAAPKDPVLFLKPAAPPVPPRRPAHPPQAHHLVRPARDCAGAAWRHWGDAP